MYFPAAATAHRTAPDSRKSNKTRQDKTVYNIGASQMASGPDKFYQHPLFLYSVQTLTLHFFSPFIFFLRSFFFLVVNNSTTSKTFWCKTFRLTIRPIKYRKTHKEMMGSKKRYGMVKRCAHLARAHHRWATFYICTHIYTIYIFVPIAGPECSALGLWNKNLCVTRWYKFISSCVCIGNGFMEPNERMEYKK